MCELIRLDSRVQAQVLKPMQFGICADVYGVEKPVVIHSHMWNLKVTCLLFLLLEMSFDSPNTNK